MNNYIKALSLSLTLTASVFTFNANAAAPTDMLLNMADSNPGLVDRLADLANYNPEGLSQLMEMTDSDAIQVEKLLNLSEANPDLFAKLLILKRAAVKDSEKPTKRPTDHVQTFGTIADGDVIQN
jgi:hypothetical protein